MSTTTTTHTETSALVAASTPAPVADFSSIPLLDYNLLSTPPGKARFLAQLRHAVINVGFLYLFNPPVSPITIASLVEEHIPALFALPQEAKDAVTMRNSEHFLGYSKLGAELTKGKVDLREQWDFATKHECRWREGDPEHWRLWGPCQVSTMFDLCALRDPRLLLSNTSQLVAIC